MAYNTNKKGAQGIGTLIIFITLILVAAAVAGVLIQTASSLQSKSLGVGRQSLEKVTTNIIVIQVYAKDTSDRYITNDKDNLTVLIKLEAGNEPIKFEDLFIKIESNYGAASYSYNRGGEIFDSDTYSARHISIDPKASQYLSDGKIAEIKFTYSSDSASADIGEDEALTLLIVHKNGTVRLTQMTTPSVMLKKITHLYP